MLKLIQDDRDLADLAIQASKLAAQVRKLTDEKEMLLWAAVRACGGMITVPKEYLESLPRDRETKYDPFSGAVILTIREEV